MKTLRNLLFAVALLGVPLVMTSCSSPPSTRVVQVQTLKAVGHTAESAVLLSAQLYRDHKITDAQARAVMDFYNLKFQPTYRVAVNAVQMNLDSFASPELIDLAQQLATLVASYK